VEEALSPPNLAANARRLAAAAARAVPRSPAWIAAVLLSERRRWFLWSPVGLGLGIGLYFALPVEPSARLIWGAAITAALLWLVPQALMTAMGPRWGARLGALSMVGLAGVLTGLGAGLAQHRTMSVAAPVIDDRTPPVTLSGRIVAVEHLEDGDRRIILRPQTIEGLAAEALPATVRIRVRSSALDPGALPTPGMIISATAILLPPPEPAAPGAFDFAFTAWFQQLGGVGFALGDITVTPSKARLGPLESRLVALERTRHQVAQRVREQLPGSVGGIAAALIVGDRSGIAEADLEALRASGLAHLLAISGLHMALVGGLMFFLIRAGLALLPAVALTKPIKKWAAVWAILGAFGYLMLSGASVSAQRAFIMLSLIFVAVLLDRPALTMRVVALAALVILIRTPEALLQAGFQMSFAAVIALIAAHETFGDRLRADKRDDAAGILSRLRVVWRYIFGVLITTLIAAGATSPFAAFHFNHTGNYELVANLVAMPLFAFVVMPSALLATLLMPLGLDGAPLQVMGFGIELTLAAAHEVASWPGSTFTVPAGPPISLILIAAGGLWLALWRRTWRVLGLAPVLLGALLWASYDRPDILIDREGRNMAVRGPDGYLRIVHPNRTKFAGEVWLRRDGDKRVPGQAMTLALDAGVRCDEAACLIPMMGGGHAAYVETPHALAEECAQARIILSETRIPATCSAPILTVQPWEPYRQGAMAVWLLDDGTIRVRTVREGRGTRPWTANR